MESWLRILFLIPLLVLGNTGCALFRHKAPPPLVADTPAVTQAEGPTTTEVTEPVIDPQVERRTIKTPAIHSSNFELGIYGGSLNIQDFGNHAVYGARLSYHITPSLFLEGNYGMSEAGKSSAEELGNFNLLKPKDRKHNTATLSLGWDLLPGQIFVGENRAYNSALYFLIGAGWTDFAADNRFTAVGGLGYRVLFTHWIAMHVDMRDYLHDTDLFGKKKVVNNFEATLGLSVYF